ncbi:protein IQ-DOMAIN 32 [Diospyros lotus]|uniref:protein IQ-DOMAIN 32 n=1 Tax=Diospyros lotus TaxID=55363 RepID=UPI00225AFC34|nr:protein IQ-DOMAIN 32 [Diospyros lotus]
MGRSTASCFKIITCGGGDNAGDKDDAGAPESNSSNDKRGWSFRKRSARHRVLSNTAISETPPLSKDCPETANVNLQVQPNTTSPEKTSELPWEDEKPQLSTSVNLKVSDAKHDSKDDELLYINPDESVAIAIQAVIRRFLAQRKLLKLKNVVKLQAAVRGHLVRRQAVGTLRCIQAIIKMQTLVRMRCTRLISEGSSIMGNSDGDLANDCHGSKILEKGNPVAEPNIAHSSIEKLLKNKFAHQLLESTPRTKRIHIKCDLSRSDSAWNWLERWMSVSSMGSMGIEQPHKHESRIELQEDKVESSACLEETGFPSEDHESTDFKASGREIEVPSNCEDNLITPDTNNFDFQAGQPTSSSKTDNPEPPQPENSGTSHSKQSSTDFDQDKQSDFISQVKPKHITGKSDTDGEQSTRSVKRSAPEQMESEGKKFVSGARRAVNPSFIAVHSKFEGLSSTTNSARLTSTNDQDVGFGSNSDTTENTIKTREIGLAENSGLHPSRVRVGSECGTELSISSTLDSPDRYETEANVEQASELSDRKSNPKGTKNLYVDANGETNFTESDLSNSSLVQPDKLDQNISSRIGEPDNTKGIKGKPDDISGANGEPVISVSAVDTLEEKQNLEPNASYVQQTELDMELDHQISERDVSKVQTEPDKEMGQQMHKSSPVVSPRSHITVPESQGTPSSQISMKTEKNRSDRSASKQKHKALSSGKKSPSKLNHDSGARSTLEQVPKEQKAGKRRNSFGSGRPDYGDQEPRDSDSSNSLPNYMQATESARAKALANSSPRSSPDLQDKDVYIKKRHSLPGANGKQGSPRIQQAMSRAQQDAKGNSHVHERKWQR